MELAKRMRIADKGHKVAFVPKMTVPRNAKPEQKLFSNEKAAQLTDGDWVELGTPEHFFRNPLISFIKARPEAPRKDIVEQESKGFYRLSAEVWSRIFVFAVESPLDLVILCSGKFVGCSFGRGAARQKGALFCQR